MGMCKGVEKRGNCIGGFGMGMQGERQTHINIRLRFVILSCWDF